MDPDKHTHQYNAFIQRLKTYLQRSRMHYSEQKLGNTIVIHVSRKKSEELPPLKVEGDANTAADSGLLVYFED